MDFHVRLRCRLETKISTILVCLFQFYLFCFSNNYCKKKKFRINLINLSGKEKTHILRYLLVVSIATGKIVLLAGPYQGASNDLTLLRACNLNNQRLPNEWTLGDKIFRRMLAFWHFCVDNFQMNPGI